MVASIRGGAWVGLTLADIRVGQDFQIVTIRGESAARLLEVGFFAGRRGRVLARLAGALVVGFGLESLALREREAQCIQVSLPMAIAPSSPHAQACEKGAVRSLDSAL